MMAKALTKEVDSKEEMMKCFKVFDKDGSGEIAREDLHHIIATMAEKLTEDEIKDMMADPDINMKKPHQKLMLKAWQELTRGRAS